MMKSYLYFVACLLILMGSIYGCGFPRHTLAEQRKILNGQTVHVYPVHISSIRHEEQFDSVIAKKIVDVINEKGEIKAVFVNRNPSINTEWFMNEAKMYKRSCDAFSGFIKNDLNEGNYALLIEFLWAPREIDVHYCLVDKEESKGVLLGLVNSHHPLHKQVNPKSNEEAFTLFCKLYDDEIARLKK